MGRRKAEPFLKTVERLRAELAAEGIDTADWISPRPLDVDGADVWAAALGIVALGDWAERCHSLVCRRCGGRSRTPYRMCFECAKTVRK